MNCRENSGSRLTLLQIQVHSEDCKTMSVSLFRVCNCKFCRKADIIQQCC